MTTHSAARDKVTSLLVFNIVTIHHAALAHQGATILENLRQICILCNRSACEVLNAIKSTLITKKSRHDIIFKLLLQTPENYAFVQNGTVVLFRESCIFIATPAQCSFNYKETMSAKEIKNARDVFFPTS